MNLFLGGTGIKRKVLSPFLISLCLFASLFPACNNGFSPHGGNHSNDPVWTDVVYSKDGNTVTVYIAPGAGKYVSPVEAGFDSTGRALSLPLAQLGHDFFEVVFFYNHNDNPDDHVVARATWQRGQRAGVSGVFREADYSGVTHAPDAGSGSAVLFVGNGQDKTLLAVGKISHVGETAVNNGPAMITTSTTSVTFTVDAFVSSVHFDPSVSSFLTAARRNPDPREVNIDNTQTIMKEIAGKEFPLFEIVRSLSELHAHYKLTTVSGNFDAYKDAIILSGEGKADKREPRYSTPDGNIRRDSNVFLDDRTVITLPNHDLNDINLPFKNPVVFSLNTETTGAGSVFALVFEIPVIALSNLSNPVQWHIRPAYGTYLYDLDDGKGGAGGAILCGNGYVHIGGGAVLVVVEPPEKYQYNYWTGTPPSHTFIYEPFDATGLNVELRDRYGHTIKTIALTDTNLQFLIGGYPIDITAPAPFEQYYGLVWIEISYKDEDFGYHPYFAKPYPILVNTNEIRVGSGAVNSFISIGPVNFTDWYATGRRQTVPLNSFDFNNMANGIHVFILTGNNNNINLAQYTLNQGVYLFMFVSQGAMNTLGRTGATAGINFNHNRLHSYNQVYFGEWPFPESLTLPPTPRPRPPDLVNGIPGNGTPTITTVPYRLNAGGTAANFGNTGEMPFASYLLTGYGGARITNTRVELPAANVWLRGQLN